MERSLEPHVQPSGARTLVRHEVGLAEREPIELLHVCGYVARRLSEPVEQLAASAQHLEELARKIPCMECLTGSRAGSGNYSPNWDQAR